MIESVKKYYKRYINSIKNIGNYFLASLVPMIISLLTSPLFALYLDPEDYAIIGFYNSFNSLLTPFVLFYFNQYYMREYFYRKTDDREILRAVMFKSFIFFSGLLWFMSVIGLVIYMRYFNAESSIPIFPYVVLSLLPLFFAGIYRLELIDYKVQRNSVSYLKLSLFTSILTALFSVFFVVFAKWHALGRMIGTLSGPLIVFVYLFYKNRKLFKIKFDWNIFRQSLMFCYPLVIAAMLTFFSNGYEKVILERHVDLALLGIYSIGVSFSSYLHVFSTALSDTFSPDIYESLAQKNFRRMAKYTFLQLGIMAIIVLLFIIFAKWAVYLLTAGRYLDSTPVARIASLSMLTSGFYGAISSIVYAYKKTKLFLYAKIIGSVVCIVMFNLMIASYGIYGAAWGHVLSHAVMTICLGTLFFLSMKSKIMYKISRR